MKIDSNIPIHPSNMPNKKQKYPWKHMKVGDSIFIPRKTTHHGVLSNVRKHNPTKKWVTRTVTENNTKGIRIWRTE